MQKHTFAGFNFRPMIGLGRTVNRFLMEGENGGGGAPNGGATATAPARESFSREYVSELREENKSWRTKYSETETANKAAQTRIAELEKANGEAITKAQQDADARVMRAELKSVALKHGVVDVGDALKLLDISAVKLDADGNLVGADELFEAAKKSKPHLFKDLNTSHTETKTPESKKNEPVDVRNMDQKDYDAQKAAYLSNARKR
ncbi:phage scaffolding protein [Paraburkholderia phosphatilytica]|uniref:phage scaffolding protein n=1 Tax=Paraburkholderia phosphatilytica TaxID=2282883 RepID=UPI000E4796F7|nr:hypothetical protein [Paraburkholderia phosphatilytica]